MQPRTKVEAGDRILCFTFPAAVSREIQATRGEIKEQEELECSIVYEEILVNTPERPSLLKEFEEAKQEQEKPGETVTIAKEDSEVENSSYNLEPESSVRSLNNNSVEESVKEPEEELKVIAETKIEFTMPDTPAIMLGERKLPKFGGNPNESFRQFFEEFEVYRSHFKLAPNDIMPHFKSAFKGNALKLLNSILQAKKDESYKDVCAKLKEFYSRSTQLPKARQKLYNEKKKKNESMEDYMVRMVDIVMSTESDEATTQELNKIIVEKLVFAMPMSIYREMEKKKDDLTPLSVIPQAMTLIRDSPDEKKCMKIMNGSGKSSDSEDSESDEEEEEHAEAKKKKEEIVERVDTKYCLVSASDSELSLLGECNIICEAESQKFEHAMLVHNQKTPALRVLLGNDFHDKLKSNVCFLRNQFTIPTPEGVVVLSRIERPVASMNICACIREKEDSHDCPSQVIAKKEIKIPPRQDAKVKVSSSPKPPTTTSYCKLREVMDGVLVGWDMLVDPDDDAIWVTNISDEEVLVMPGLKFGFLRNDLQLRAPKKRQSMKLLQYLRNQFTPRLGGNIFTVQGGEPAEEEFDINPELPEEDRKAIRAMLNNNSDVFMKENEPLRTTSIMKVRLPLKDDGKVIYQHNYSLSPVQDKAASEVIQKMLQERVLEPAPHSNYRIPFFLVEKGKDKNDVMQYRLLLSAKKLNECFANINYAPPKIPHILAQLKGKTLFSTLDLSSSFRQLEIDERDRHILTIQHTGRITSGEEYYPDPRKFRELEKLLTAKNRAQARSIFCYYSHYRTFIKDFHKISKPVLDAADPKAKFEWGPDQINAVTILHKMLIDNVALMRFDPDRDTIVTVDGSPVYGCGAVLLQKCPKTRKFRPVSIHSMQFPKSQRKISANDAELLALYYALQKFRMELHAVQSFEIHSDCNGLQHSTALPHPSSCQARVMLYLSQFHGKYKIKYKPGREQLPDEEPRNPEICKLLEQKSIELLGSKQDTSITAKYMEERQSKEENNCNLQPEILRRKETSPGKEMGLINVCSCCFQPDDLKTLLKIDGQKPMKISHTPETMAPITMKIEGVKRSGVIDAIAPWSILNVDLLGEGTNASLMTGDITVRPEKLIPITAFFHATIELKPGEETVHPFLVAEIDREFILGKEMIDKYMSDERKPMRNEKEPEETQNRAFQRRKSRQSPEILTELRISVPDSLRKGVLRICHDLIFGNHYGARKTISLMKGTYHWETMEKDTRNYIASCEKCSKFKPKLTKAGLLQPVKSYCPFQKMACDFTEYVKSTSGNRYALVMVDLFSSYIYAVPTKRRRTVDAIKAFKQVLQYIVIPEVLICDAGSHFTSDEFRDFVNKLGIRELHVAPTDVHFCNGAAEAAIKKINESVRIYCEKDISKWEEALPYVLNTINVSVLKHGKSPAELLYGVQRQVPGSPCVDTEKAIIISEIISEFEKNREETREEIMKKKEKLQESQKKTYDRNRNEEKYEPNQKIYYLVQRKSRFDYPAKLQQKFRLGTVIVQEGPVTYSVRPEEGKYRKPVRVHVSQMKPFVERDRNSA
ncbi:hypothetical protein ONE63_006709 [Megalurothrips usitatus]|uniref:RNA-directed DNA polymerase n=1 Tax=Megalurothrips usitatus TaxID=439358 RepID=A0AAV7XZ59_9NEOP|nr:hypothetical protein ONE63_006709 [Megalurothrips usitatus]